ncbi:MAG: carbamoyltransferase [Desulfatibacillaceae bacterium]|nr:carbamoyltransferase [Desulfatibacillaceae bacterium]
MNILGISCFYHDSAACLVRDGDIAAAAQEERFSRMKHDSSFPLQAIGFCLEKEGLLPENLDFVVFYDKPLLSFERILLTHLHLAPRGLGAWIKAMPKWLVQNLHVPKILKKKLGYQGITLYTEHHEAHAASAFYPSPFDEAAILTVDGVGEWATATWGTGRGNRIELAAELCFPDSLGLLYSAFTGFCGFKVNSGEYKLMGLAPYGRPVYRETILKELVDLKPDGSLRLNMSHFAFAGTRAMTSRRFARLFGGSPREPESPITQREMDLAASIQAVTEEALIKMACFVHEKTRMKNLCLAGGVALNCVANSKILKQTPFEDIWIQPAAGDAGGALGAALAVWHRYLEKPRQNPAQTDSMKGAFLGPAFCKDSIADFLETAGYPFEKLEPATRAASIAWHLAQGKIVGYFCGPMEFGPRALGARSILADPRPPDMQEVLNTLVKNRESFRPFAPCVLEENVGDYFDLDRPSPFMLLAAQVKEAHRLSASDDEQSPFLERITRARSSIPAVTHLDYSARVQTVSNKTKPDFAAVLKWFERLTGCPVLVNTSFNVRGEPIVCTPQDAYRCFMQTNIDILVMEDCLLEKEQQPCMEDED